MGAGARAVLRPRRNCSSRGIATQASKKKYIFFFELAPKAQARIFFYRASKDSAS